MRTLLYISSLLLCSLFIWNVDAQPKGFVLIPVYAPQYVQVWSPWYTLTLSRPAKNAFTISLSSSQADFNPATLHFSPTDMSATFRMKPNGATGNYTLNYALDAAGQDEFMDIPFNSITVLQRTATLDYTSNYLVIDYPTDPIKISISHPSSADLTFQPASNDGTVKFTPSTVTIPAGSLSGSFQALATQDIQPNKTEISLTVSGTESSWYITTNVKLSLFVDTREIIVPSFSVDAVLGFNATTSYAYARDYPNSTLTVTPVATDTVFTPASFQFSPDVRVVPFNYVTTSPTSKQVRFYVSGDGVKDYGRIANQALSVTYRKFIVQAPSLYVLNVQTKMSINLAAPPVNPINIQFFAANCQFNPTNVTLTGTDLSVNVNVMPVALGSDTISFLVTGQDQDWYTKPQDIPLEVVRGQFIGPDDWYLPYLFIGVKSPQLPVRVSVPPNTNVSLTPVSADMVFTPPTLYFTSSTLQQFFTMTPNWTNTASSAPTVSVVMVDFIVGGADLFSYDAPTSYGVVVSRRSVQFEWSVHVKPPMGAPANTPKNLYLGKQYIVWATLSSPPENEVTITPTNPYMKFDPPVLRFSPTNLHIKYFVTVTAAVGDTTIDYIMGGQNGGLYRTAASDSYVTTSIRPLNVYQAQIVPDNRSSKQSAVLVDAYNPAVLSSNHIYSFSLISGVIPDNSLTLTPKSHHIDFDPPSITLGTDKVSSILLRTHTSLNDYFNVSYPVVVANFSVTAKAPGAHLVWIELSGGDGNFYDVPDDFILYFNNELRLQGETPNQISGASVFASPAIALLLIVLCVLSIW